uniref:Golgin subfamily A member 1 n=1 Tax=Denticeps clupeoides TaxID=299321 RepID=A0AAY4BL63_9TELE
MFAKLKKKIAEEAASTTSTSTPRTGGRMPRSMSKESITSVGADSGDDFASDGSSSRGDDLSSQILRRNDQIRKLEAKLSDYAEQLRLLQKTKDKLEVALEKHQDSSMRKLQEQNEAYQSNRAKMAEGMALALDKKDQEWMEKMASLEQEKASLSARLAEMTEQSLSLFQKRDDLDELEGFQQQELAKVKHMLLRREEQLGQRERELQQKEGQLQTARSSLAEAQAKLHRLDGEHQENCRINEQLQAERQDLLRVRDQSEQKVGELEARSRDLQELIQQVSEDFQQSQKKAQDLESSLNSLQTEHEELQLEHEQHKQKAAVREEERECVLSELQEKVSSLERRLEGNLSQDEHLQELLKEKSSVEQRLEEVRVELLQERSSHADTVSSLEAQTSRLNGSVAELQMLLRHKDDSSKAYRERTDAQISSLEQQVDEFTRKLRSAERQLADSEAHVQTLQEGWVEERERLQQQVGSQRQRGLERCGQLEEQLGVLRRQRDAENAASQAALTELEDEKTELLQRQEDAEVRLHTIAQELEQARAELSSRQTVSVEIAKALEDTRRQKEELQIQVGEMFTTQQVLQEDASKLSDQLQAKHTEIQVLKEVLQAARGDVDQLKADAADREQVMSSLRQEVVSQTEQLDSCQSRVLDLEGELESLSEQLQTSEVCDEEQNGAVTVDDLDHLQKVNRDLELQLSDKNKKLKPESEADCRPQENRGERQDDRPNQDTAATAPGPGPVTQNTTVINSADLTDTREINFEYLKHVVLKFMSSREAEAYQLIRAVSVLLRFTREEEDLLKQTLEYKMSWFGSKPAPKGIARPSISGATDHWS